MIEIPDNVIEEATSAYWNKPWGNSTLVERMTDALAAADAAWEKLGWKRVQHTNSNPNWTPPPAPTGAGGNHENDWPGTRLTSLTSQPKESNDWEPASAEEISKWREDANEAWHHNGDELAERHLRMDATLAKREREVKLISSAYDKRILQKTQDRIEETKRADIAEAHNQKLMEALSIARSQVVTLHPRKDPRSIKPLDMQDHVQIAVLDAIDHALNLKEVAMAACTHNIPMYQHCPECDPKRFTPAEGVEVNEQKAESDPTKVDDPVVTLRDQIGQLTMTNKERELESRFNSWKAEAEGLLNSLVECKREVSQLKDELTNLTETIRAEHDERLVAFEDD